MSGKGDGSVRANGGTITVRLYGALRQAVGSKEVSLTSEPTTLQEALTRISQEHARSTPLLFDQQGEVWRSIILLLNDEPAPDGPATSLHSGDVVTVLMPLAGG